MLKKIVVILGGLLVLFVITPVILSPRMHVVRSIEVQTTQKTTHAFLTDLNQYPKWNPFSENDPSSINQMTGSGVGSVLAWKSETTGEGRMTITQIRPNELVELKLEFFKPFAGEAAMGWATEGIDSNKTRMTWSLDQDLPYFQRYFGLFMNGMMEKTFDRGLGNLKRELEKS